MNPNIVLIIEKNDYERNILIRGLIHEGHSVFDARSEMEAIDVVLCLSSHHRIEVIIHFDLTDKDHSLSNLLKLCSLKFGTSPIIISDNDHLNIFRNQAEAVI
jgi:hypothetical protein